MIDASELPSIVAEVDHFDADAERRVGLATWAERPDGLEVVTISLSEGIGVGADGPAPRDRKRAMPGCG